MRYAAWFFLLLIGCSVPAIAKKITKDELLFEKANAIQQALHTILDEDELADTSTKAKIRREYAQEIKENMLDKALDYYQELVDSFPKSPLVFRALNNKGLIEYELGDNHEARQTFLAILNSKANDRERGGAGEGLMMEPYANYKNTAAKMLAEICIKDSHTPTRLSI